MALLSLPTQRIRTVVESNPHSLTDDENSDERYFHKVYPHACGENFGHKRRGQGVLGPSPRVWRKHYFSRFEFHPLHGPSPRVWRKLLSVMMPNAPARSIPTRVEKTTITPHRPRCITVHPHACGENWDRRPAMCSALGPSPRVWRKPFTRTFQVSFAKSSVDIFRCARSFTSEGQ